MKNVVFKSIVVLVITLSSCTMKKNYYYVIDGKEVEIKADSDSSAYLEAYQKLIISKKVYNDMKDTYGTMYSKEPTSFTLYNNKREDITYQVYFKSKDSLEKNISNMILDRPNIFDDTNTSGNKGASKSNSKYDTSGLYLAPIKVLSSKFVEEEYSSYKDIALRFKNTSNKTVSAIRFKWYGENAFKEPADMGGLTNGWGGGFMDDPLKPGATKYSEWRIMSRDGKKILIAYPYEVVFADGSKWLLE